MSLLDDTRDDSFNMDEYGVPMSYTYPPDDSPTFAVHQCNVCNKIFMSYKGLQQHAVIHTDTKPFLCEVCGRGFRFKSNMFEHRTVHTGYTPHICPFCGKQFRLKGNMKKHMRIHVTNKEELEAAYRPYSCNRRVHLTIPDNALVIRGSPVPFLPAEKRRQAPKLTLGKDPSKWIELICHNQLLPTMPFNEKMLRARMRLTATSDLFQMIDCAKPLEFEIFNCPYCKYQCTGREECEAHLYITHGKKTEEMLMEPDYCHTCMRVFVNNSMFVQHQSYHTRVHMMLSNQELDNNTVPPEVDLTDFFYSLFTNCSSILHDPKITAPSL